MLDELYRLTSDEAILKKRIDELLQVKEAYAEARFVSRVAEACWKIAQIYSLLGQYKSASSSYDEAVNFFVKSSEKIPEARDYYLDLARVTSGPGRRSRVREIPIHPVNARNQGITMKQLPDCLKSPKNGTVLHRIIVRAPLLEEADELGRPVIGTAATRASVGGLVERLQFARNLFSKSYDALNQVSKSKPGENRISKKEIDATATIAGASLTCQKYCHARILIEEAKMANSRGENIRASECTHLVRIPLNRYLAVQQGEVGKKELSAIIKFARAWEKFNQAEASSSFKLFKESAELFKKTEEVGDSSLSLIARGNENYSIALAASLKFQESMSMDDYASAKSHLTIASEYYSKAGFPSEAEWFKGTERMLDGYLHVINALKEPDQEKKAKHYLPAEKVLRMASKIYEKAGYPSKRDEAMSKLKNVREERELALSFASMLSAPVIVSDTSLFSAATTTPEQSSGIEQFEGANVQVAVHVPDKVLSVEEEFDVRIDLINTGREAANLHFVDNISKFLNLRKRYEKDSPKGIDAEQLSVLEDSRAKTSSLFRSNP